MESFLIEHGIKTEDVPKLLSAVAVMKYVGWALTLLVSIRFRPVKVRGRVEMTL